VNISVTGLPTLILQVGFIVVFSAPVWLAARLVGAANPTLLRAVLSLFAGAIGSAVSIVVGGGFALLLAPLSFLLAFKFVLGTSFLGAIGLALLALVGYAAMFHFLGPGVPLSGTGPVTTV